LQNNNNSFTLRQSIMSKDNERDLGKDNTGQINFYRNISEGGYGDEPVWKSKKQKEIELLDPLEYLKERNVPLQKLDLESNFLTIDCPLDYEGTESVFLINKTTGLISVELEFRPNSASKNTESKSKLSSLTFYSYEDIEYTHPITGEVTDVTVITGRERATDTLLRKRTRMYARQHIVVFQDWDPKTETSKPIRNLLCEIEYMEMEGAEQSAGSPVKWIEKFRSFFIEDLMVVYYIADDGILKLARSTHSINDRDDIIEKWQTHPTLSKIALPEDLGAAETIVF